MWYDHPILYNVSSVPFIDALNSKTPGTENVTHLQRVFLFKDSSAS